MLKLMPGERWQRLSFPQSKLALRNTASKYLQSLQDILLKTRGQTRLRIEYAYPTSSALRMGSNCQHWKSFLRLAQWYCLLWILKIARSSVLSTTVWTSWFQVLPAYSSQTEGRADLMLPGRPFSLSWPVRNYFMGVHYQILIATTVPLWEPARSAKGACPTAVSLAWPPLIVPLLETLTLALFMFILENCFLTWLVAMIRPGQGG